MTDLIFTRFVFAKMADGKRAVFWVQTTEKMSNDEAMQQPWHGPFGTEAEARADAQAVLLGPDCEIVEGGVWDAAWDRRQ